MKFFLLVCFVVISITSNSQIGKERELRTITGRLKNNQANTSVILKGTRIATASDSKGYYKLVIPDSIKLSELELVFTNIGLQSDDLDISKTSAFYNYDINNTLWSADSIVSKGSFFKVNADIETTLFPIIPSFSWPPPAASAIDVLNRNFFPGCNRLGHVNQKLVDALKSLDYTESSYYAVPNGFALVTRLERINTSGDEPVSFEGPERWAEAVTFKIRTVTDYLWCLVNAKKGSFRTIVFIVTNIPTGTTNTRISRDEVIGWLKTGSNMLPAEIAELPFSQGYVCTAYIYEFEKKENSAATLIGQSNFQGRKHIRKICDKLKPH